MLRANKGNPRAPAAFAFGSLSETIIHASRVHVIDDVEDGDYAGSAMVDVIRNTALLSAADRAAIATYVASLPPRQGPRRPAKK